MRAIFLTILCAFSISPMEAKDKPPIIHRIPLPPQPDYSALDWLGGEWTGQTLERSPQGEISLNASFDLEKRFMVFREQVSIAASDTAPESKETWMGILSPGSAGPGFILRTFSDTGFITRYRVTVEQANVYLNSDGGELPPPGWLLRRLWQRTDVGDILESVQVAPPHRAFFDYYTARLTRKAAQ